MLGDVEMPYYWWTAGGLWGAMLDYYHYTGDPTYNDVVIDALLAPANLGPYNRYLPPQRASQEGNDDLFFWGVAAMTAAEYNFPQPNSSLPSWLSISSNVFNSLESRWDDQNCGGGLLWQIYASNPNGLTYKNSVTNGGFFQLAARLARATQNDTYLDWAEKAWNWSWNIGLIDHQSWHVYDGTSITDDCAKINQISFTYTSGIYLYGAAVMANYTGKAEWKDRATNLLNGSLWFFWPYKNASDIMYEGACEPYNDCTTDSSTFKGFLARFMWKSVIMQPDLAQTIDKYLDASAKAAAEACSGSANGTLCGEKWYVGGYDGNPGFGQNMCALEVVQGLLAASARPPFAAGEIKTVRSTDWGAQNQSATAAATTSSTSAKPTKRESAGSLAEPEATGLLLVLASAMWTAWSLA